MGKKGILQQRKSLLSMPLWDSQVSVSQHVECRQFSCVFSFQVQNTSLQKQVKKPSNKTLFLLRLFFLGCRDTCLFALLFTSQVNNVWNRGSFLWNILNLPCNLLDKTSFSIYAEITSVVIDMNIYSTLCSC